MIMMSKQRILLLLSGIMFSFLVKAEIEFPKIRGWSMSDSAKKYNPETLWEYINGAAESYLNYNFRQLEVMEYSRSEDEYIKVEVYLQGSDLDAFGIYAFERPEKADFLDIGGEGYMIYSSLNYYAGEYYVKIHSHQSDEKTLEAIRSLGSKVATHIGGDTEKPLLLDLLPDYEKISGSEKYFSTNFLGYSFLNKVIVADYLSENEKYKMFIILCDSTAAAVNTLNNYFKQTKTEAQITPDKVYEVNDMFNGYVALVIVNRFVLGILDMSDKELAQDYLAQFSEFVMQSDTR